ncbi:ankyrin repeat domain-containing protein, chloroplastic [Phalaenopsis equestris]|uniref:ankyrin repeat domain-containing protein, chloroplastic n=1 Tax=Phalaenopsis equestris TaxID=78828 RepID=UPI0009E1A457|nr:ankyrin repeat domain-containing protein, chloroplastic [Phalaenopsis equestris]
MASLPPASSLRMVPYSTLRSPLLFPSPSYLLSKHKTFHSPSTSILSVSHSLPQVSTTSATSFPYSQLRHRQHPKQEEPVKERTIGDSEEPHRDDDDDHPIGDCIVFEEGAFEEENPVLSGRLKQPKRKISNSEAASAGDSDSLVPEKWKEVVAEINLTKKEKRKMAHQLKFGSRLEARKKIPVPDKEEYLAYREMKLSQLNPVVLDSPKRFPREAVVLKDPSERSSGRVAPRNPRLGIREETMEDITDFFNSGDYVPGERNDDKKPQGRRKLFTEEEKVLLNKRIPNLGVATSRKWLPLHTLASSGEFYLLDLLLKHSVDINAVDEDGLTAIHKAILSKKHAITSYLLRNSANPFVRDMDGATLMHYAVLAASSDCIKILMLYNVDINLADNDGWTPLHLAVQTQRADIVRLLLKKGVDRTLKNKDGLKPLDLCLYCGHNVKTYEIIKLLKEAPKPNSHG